MHIWCVGSIGCLCRHCGVGFGARCHRRQGGGASVPCLHVSSLSKQKRAGRCCVWYGNYCDTLRMEHVKCYDPDTILHSIRCMFSLSETVSVYKIEMQCVHGGCCLWIVSFFLGQTLLRMRQECRLLLKFLLRQVSSAQMLLPPPRVSGLEGYSSSRARHNSRVKSVSPPRLYKKPVPSYFLAQWPIPYTMSVFF